LRSSACIRALRRFIARRGCPKLIISDNAKTFKAEETRNFLHDLAVNWKFIMPRAPWQGGVYERMVRRSTKRCLKKVLRNASLSYEELETVIYGVECVINSRPLTYIGKNGCEEPVTPNHLMFGHNLHLVHNEPSAIDSSNSKISSKRRFL
jgi:transposase InsO family protein